MQEKTIGAGSHGLFQLTGARELAGRWVLFGLYCVLIFSFSLRHELWGDELQAWNLCRSSSSFFELARLHHHNLHPYVWNAVVFILSRFTSEPGVMQGASAVAICAAGFVLLFRSSFRPLLCGLILVGYYFIYEYAAFGRGYGLALLFHLLLCGELGRGNRLRFSVYCVLLVLLAGSHVLGLFLAAGFHAYYFVAYTGTGRLRRYVLPVVLLLLTAVSYLVPETGTAFGFYFGQGHLNNLSSVPLQVPLRAFIPLPVLWRHEFWNSYMVLELLWNGMPGKLLALLLSAGMLVGILWLLKNSRAVVCFFIISTLLILGFGLLFPLVSARYVGFLYMVFLGAIWLHPSFESDKSGRKALVYALVILQVPGGIFAVVKDWGSPFSQVNEVRALFRAAGPRLPIVTDFWGLNYLAAVYDTSFYCVETRREERRLLINAEMLGALKPAHRYSRGLHQYFNDHAVNTVYLFTNSSPARLLKLDTLLRSGDYLVECVFAREGAIEKFSNIFLYKVHRRQDLRNSPH